MSTSQASTSNGRFEGRSASFTYENVASNAGLRIEYDEAKLGSLRIEERDIIAVIGTSKSNSDSHIIKYVRSQGSGQVDSSEIGIEYHEAVASGLPQDFIRHNLITPSFPWLVSQNVPSIPGILHIIISTHSGSYLAQSFYENIVKRALPQDLDPKIIITDSESSVKDYARATLLRHANEGIPQTVLLLSGDGGIVDLLNALQTEVRASEYVKPTVGLLVMGTGNALANSSGLNQDNTYGLRSCFRGKPHPLPIFIATFSPGAQLVTNEGADVEPFSHMRDAGSGVLFGAVVVSWALHASLVADSDTTEYRKFGSERFTMAARELLTPADGTGPHKYLGRLTMFKRDKISGLIEEHFISECEHGYVLATLVSNLEKTLTISPRSQPLDGQLRLLRFGPLEPGSVMDIMGGAFQGGKHVNHESVTYEEIEGLRIDFEEEGGENSVRWRRVCVDGKIVRVPEGGWVDVRKSQGDVLDLLVDLSQDDA